MKYAPERIICITEESTETIYLLGEEDRIVGISGFTVRPERARKEKPKVSTFLDANYEEILDLKPDLVIGFSDIQADIAQKLIKEGVSVWISNHRSLEEIFKFIMQLGALLDRKEAAQNLLNEYFNQHQLIDKEVSSWNTLPKVYFEEWYDPLISGIQWVSELIQLCGGIDVFPHYATESLAKNRIIKDPAEVITADPDIILASWCGKAFKQKKMLARAEWNSISAIKNNQVFEIDSSVILQPGPAAINEGAKQLHRIFKNWHSTYGA